MKKLGIVLFSLILLFGCRVIDYNTMVCVLEGSNFSYEIQYSGNEVKALYVVQDRNVSGLSEEEFKNVSNYVKQRAKKYSKVDGIKEQVTIDERMIYVKTQIDYKEYDLEKDSLELLFAPLSEKNLESIQSAREALTAQGLQCDEIVKKKLN